ncbi:alpha/beta hydrolase [Spirosoma sp. BT702]|uniref:Alpha/beta hydrolase n=1 Tax=Spirosoma profusum TaxID=2771354 RepID=A0A926Y1Q1_9BACT|nr:alpha/beta hydrolase [Spirosoma profusum]MBD2700251.1 alpha/beta hydrolase [Spirosoma profusum]
MKTIWNVSLCALITLSGISSCNQSTVVSEAINPSGARISQAQDNLPTVQQIRQSFDLGYDTTTIVPKMDVFKTEVRNVWTGTASIPVQIYYPNNKKNLPIIYYMHGGAFVWSPGIDMHISRLLCNRTESVVVSIDYRLAPEHPFPATVNECFAVWNWVDQQAENLHGNRKKVILVGDSGGGNYLGAILYKQKSNKLKPLACVYVNPAPDLRPTAPGIAPYELMRSWYLNNANPNDPLASPLLTPSFKHYPQSLILVSEIDGLKAQGVMLADKLKNAGVDTQLFELKGLDHLGFYWCNTNPIAKPAIDKVVSYINTVKTKKD